MTQQKVKATTPSAKDIKLIITKQEKKLLKEAKKATEKLNTYSRGVYLSGGRDATAKYNELNSIANRAVRKLPVHLRSRTVIENFG